MCHHCYRYWQLVLVVFVTDLLRLSVTFIICFCYYHAYDEYRLSLTQLNTEELSAKWRSYLGTGTWQMGRRTAIRNEARASRIIIGAKCNSKQATTQWMRRKIQHAELISRWYLSLIHNNHTLYLTQHRHNTQQRQNAGVRLRARKKIDRSWPRKRRPVARNVYRQSPGQPATWPSRPSAAREATRSARRFAELLGSGRPG